ncbi:hypothetical protein XYCOK13_43820 [Xylanibacillus composti]|uniref:Uncharacterized protein n=1 Tax=Xylanibacillus composti TaxID=1572762 RepID=A0A8J4H974_9BACL|nr:hypothetical protein XYCOK13_43820 [Xylanibacillus composti]
MKRQFEIVSKMAVSTYNTAFMHRADALDRRRGFKEVIAATISFEGS